MKKNLLIACLIGVACLPLQAQTHISIGPERHGGNLNLGLGVGYYGYVGRAMPALMINYEFDVAKNITLAPFVGFYSYTSKYYWGNHNYDYRYYSYRATAIPLGIKGAYYFDGLLSANKKWDFYAALSLGFVIRTVSWDNDYYGDRNAARISSPLFLAAHAGARYHVNNRLGLFLDLSSGMSTLGLSFKIFGDFIFTEVNGPAHRDL